MLALVGVVAWGSAVEGQEISQAEILWDSWGVPHIYAETDDALAYGFGWAQARNHGDLVLSLYGQARGRAAEYWGGEHLEQDRLLRTLGIPARGVEWLEAQDPEMSAYLEAFVRGINAYCAAHPEVIDGDMKVVLPVTAADVLAHAHRVMSLEFVGRTLGPRVAAWGESGSNGWAIAPSHSTSGNALLLVNPHLPWGGFLTWFEAHLVTPEMDMTGATLVGVPVLALGFNEHLGWTHTDNPIDGMDLYELTLSEGGYVFDGEVQAFEAARETLLVKGEDGSTSEEVLEVRRSVHGPVLQERGGRALAVRLTGLDRPHAVRQWQAMCQARSLDEFVAALGQHQMPMWNVMYADGDGHILYRYSGLVPRRPHGDRQYWANPVPGDTSSTLWTSVHSFEELPMVVDPPNGWVQNANDPPWSSTYPPSLDPADFPAYLPQPRMDLRPQRSVKMLLEHESMSFDDLLACKHSTRMEAAERLVDDLVAAALIHGNADAHEAAAVLEQWDRTADAGSAGGALFALWFYGMREAVSGSLYGEPWNPQKPLDTPRGLADPRAAAAVLGAVAARMRADTGRLDLPWGEGTRLRLNGTDLPASGGPGGLGIFRVLAGPLDPDGRFRVMSGDSFVAAVEFTDPVRAEVLLSYGNASQPGSPHIGDQLELLSQQKLRSAWRTRKEIEANVEYREVVGPPR